MPAKDLYHQTVKQALVKAGWTITHDPLPLKWAKRNLAVDLGAERLIAAEQKERKIAVEVKSFIGDSLILDLEKALGNTSFIREYYKEVNQIETCISLFLYFRLKNYLNKISLQSYYWKMKR